MLVVPVVEGFAVVAPPCFEIGGAPHVLLHLHLPVHLGLDHLRLVDHVGDEALALAWAATHPCGGCA